MSNFHPLKVIQIITETSDTVSIVLDVPAPLNNEFRYKPGQYLTFRMIINGNEIRRSYSLSSAPSTDAKLKVTVKQISEGLASTFLTKNLNEGDVLETLTPRGHFFAETNPENAKNYAGIAAGSGITPVISILKETLATEPKSKFHLIYINRNSETTIFLKELNQLKEKYNDRLQLILWNSRDTNPASKYSGRPDKVKLSALFKNENLEKCDDYFICGPEELIRHSDEILREKGIDKSKIHFEYFTAPVKSNKENKTEEKAFTGNSKVKVIIDGIETEFELPSNGSSVLDAAIDAGADAPFSCKGAVCCTCKAKIINGKASMDMNYSLTDKEVEQGYILTCQAHPQTSELTVDFDVN